MDIYSLTAFVIGLSMMGELFRLLVGPSSWDRLLAANLIALKGLMLLTVFAYKNQLNYLLDVALVYGIIGYIGIILIANYLAEGRHDHD